MFESNNNNGSNDAETNDESTARKFEDPVRNFLGRLAGDEEESETGDAAERGESYTPPEEPYYVSQWKLGSHSVPSGISKDEIENEISRIKDVNPDLAGVLEEASSMVEHSETSGYECKVCGLYHGHSDGKNNHDIRSSLNVRDEFTSQMEFCPFCHCGVNELAMWIDFIAFSNVVVFEDQERFESVLELDNDVLMDFCHKYREMVNEHERETEPTVAEALEAIGGIESVSSDIAEELNLFFGRWHDIKQAANRAPIAGETRNVIDDLRTELEAEVEAVKEREQESEEGAEEKDPLHGRDYGGEVVFFNDVGGYGFIESEDVADDVFFYPTEIEIDSIEQGVNVAFDIERDEEGPMARSVIILDDE